MAATAVATPITPENAAMRVELGLSFRNGFMAFSPDLCDPKLKLVRSVIPEGAYEDFRFNQNGGLQFSVIKLALEGAERGVELRNIADDLAEAWSERYHSSLYIDPRVRGLGDFSMGGVPLAEEFFFLEQASQNGNGTPASMAA